MIPSTRSKLLGVPLLEILNERLSTLDPHGDSSPSSLLPLPTSLPETMSYRYLPFATFGGGDSSLRAFPYSSSVSSAGIVLPSQPRWEPIPPPPRGPWRDQRTGSSRIWATGPVLVSSPRGPWRAHCTSSSGDPPLGLTRSLILTYK
jgi:hypothetical protein